MTDSQKRRAAYIENLTMLASMGFSAPDFGEKWTALINHSIEAGDKICRQLENIFNNKQDEDEQTFVADQIRSILNCIEILKTSHRLTSIAQAIETIALTSQAVQHPHVKP